MRIWMGNFILSTASLPITLVYLGRGDQRNILGIIVTVIIVVKAGIINGRYSRSQFDLCPQLHDVDQEN